eukprot:SAG11_NODE_445_length_9408_cov_3.801590_1_plen_83_part_00
MAVLVNQEIDQRRGMCIQRCQPALAVRSLSDGGAGTIAEPWAISLRAEDAGRAPHPLKVTHQLAPPQLQLALLMMLLQLLAL